MKCALEKRYSLIFIMYITVQVTYSNVDFFASILINVNCEEKVKRIFNNKQNNYIIVMLAIILFWLEVE